MPVTGYSRLQVGLHWGTAVLVAGQFLFADGIGRAFRAGLEAGAMALTPAAVAHMAAGALILLAALWRLLLRRERGVPPPPAADPPLQRRAAALAHAALYAVLLVMPLAGIVAWANASEPAGELHETLGSVLLVLAGLHVLAAVVGQYVQKTGVLARMLKPQAD